MKEKLMFLTTLLILTIASYAQQGLNIEILAQPGINMGGDFQVPLAVTNLNSAFVNMSKASTYGVNVGAKIGYNFNDKLGISLGLLYALQGQKYQDYTWSNVNGGGYYIGYNTGYNITFSRTVSLNYFKIPVLINLLTTKADEKVSFICSAGFYFGFLLSYDDVSKIASTNGNESTLTADGSSYTVTGSNPESGLFISKPYKSADIGGVLALGLQFKLSDKICMPLMLNYQIGFFDIKNDASQYSQSGASNAFYWQPWTANNDPNQTLSYHNSSLGLTIGIKIKL
jgi:hypothetical protein